MDNKGEFIDKFSILSNEPLFKDELQEEDLDAFNHKAYAETLHALFVKNKPPLSVGLFGGWGIGKSTILFSLRNSIKNKGTDLEPIYFNAWKYSGDSFRREFLLSVALQLKANNETINRLKQIYHSQLKRDDLANIKEQIKSILNNKLKLNAVVVTNVVMSFLVLSLVSLVLWLIDHNINLIAIPLIGAFITYILNNQLPQIIEINSAGIIDPKIIFPEQFEEEFEKLVSKISKPVLIIIDDFDRCHAGTITDILTSIKTFLKTKKTENCYFLVALDDKAVTKILSQSNERYEDEELRKYFDVTVRVSPLDKSDLIDFANTIARQTDLPPEVIQIGVLAKCDDVRKIKHFINTFKTKINILTQRGERYIPSDFKLADHLASLAKIIVIEELFPDVFSRAIREPQFLTKLENHIIIKTKDDEIESMLSENIALREFMEATVHVKIEHPELFTFLKVSNLQYRISRGTELYKAIIAKNENIIEDILHGLHDEDKSCLVDLLKNDMLDKSDGIFLKNTTSFCLDILQGEYFNSGQKAALAPQLCNSFKKQALYNYDSNALFNVAAITNDQKWLKIIADKIRDEVGNGAFIEDNLSAVINSYYSHNLFIKYPGEQYELSLNQAIDNAVSRNNAAILSTIDRIKTLEESEIKNGQPILPKVETMNKIIGSIDVSNGSEKGNNNDLKTKIIFDRWDQKCPVKYRISSVD